MRVISGSLGGRQFKSPHGHRTHPMSDKIRGALFGVLGDIDGLTVLDAFAGSGAIAFEAISRGATSALLVDNDMQAQRAIEENIKTLGVSGQARLIKANVGSWSDNSAAQQFDLVVADPPYDHLQIGILEKLLRNLAAGGTFVLSWPSDVTVPELMGMRQVAKKSYGDAQLVFYQQTG